MGTRGIEPSPSGNRLPVELSSSWDGLANLTFSPSASTTPPLVEGGPPGVSAAGIALSSILELGIEKLAPSFPPLSFSSSECSDEDPYTSTTHILVTGLLKTPCCVLTTTTRTWPSLPGKTEITRPFSHSPLKRFSSTITTMSPI